MVDSSACCVGLGKVVNPDVLYFKEGEVGVACEVEVGVDLGCVEGDWEECLDTFDFVKEVKVRGGGGDGPVGSVWARQGSVVVARDSNGACCNFEVGAEVVE